MVYGISGLSVVADITAFLYIAEEWSLKPKDTVSLIRLAVVSHGEELQFAEEI